MSKISGNFFGMKKYFSCLKLSYFKSQNTYNYIAHQEASGTKWSDTMPIADYLVFRFIHLTVTPSIHPPLTSWYHKY